MSIALTRTVSPKLADCELTHLQRVPISFRNAKKQHREYEKALEAMGYTVRRLSEKPECPDGVFVEDTALVLPEIGIITRPGATSRRKETASMAKVLEEYRDLRYIQRPATLDGGDVLVVGKKIFAGLSSRTNKSAIKQLQGLLKPYGYRVEVVRIATCLHLKTAVSKIDKNLLFMNPEWVNESEFSGFHCEYVDPAEPFGANVMIRKNQVLCSEACLETILWFEKQGYDVLSTDQSELAKAEAGLTCCSVIVD